MNKRILLLFLSLALLLSFPLSASGDAFALSLFGGVDEALYINNENEDFLFRTAFKVDLDVDLLHRDVGMISHGPYLSLNYTSETLAINGLRYNGYAGGGVGYSILRKLEGGMALAGYLEYGYGGYLKSDIRYSSLDLGAIYSFPIGDDLALSARCGLSYKGNLYSFYCQAGCRVGL